MWSWGYPYMMGYGGWILPLLFWIFVIFIILFVFRGSRHGRCGWRHWDGDGPKEGNSKTPLDILKERYAKGEITEEQLAKMKKELEK